MSTAHAILGASSAHRWMPCPGSIAMSKDMPNEDTPAARQGSAAHAIGEMALNSGADASQYLGFVVKEYSEIDVDEEMCACVQEYLDCVRGEIELYAEAGFTDWELGVEVKFDLSHIYPGMFGTCDAVLYLPAWKKLIVFDYKHGWVSVPVIRNPQTLYYALGAISGKHNRAIDEIELVIVQPRSGQHAIIKRWSCDFIALTDFMGDLIAAAEETEKSDAALNPGEWCKFCPAAPICRALAEKVMQLAAVEYDILSGDTPMAPERMTPQQLKEIYENAAMIKGWIKSVEAYARSCALNGSPPEGFMLVEGRSHRKWRDEDTVVKRLEVLQFVGDIDGELYTMALKSPKQIEDIMPKSRRSEIEDLWVKGRGALTLVPETDEREPAKVDALKEF